jgi:serine phosphatase RsbU (regulator of sigma subunit)
LDRSIFANPEGMTFTYAWRFKPGDDPAWADPAFDDSGWAVVEPLMSPGNLPQGGWPGVGWFRRHVVVPPEGWGVPLAVSLTAAGAADLYIDGRPVHRVGGCAGGPPPELPPARYGPWRAEFSARRDHVIAVRYACAVAPGTGPISPGIGFTLTIAPEGRAAKASAAVTQRNSELLGPLAVVLVFVALLHLALFWFYPRRRENLFYALNMAVLAVIVFRDLAGAGASPPAWLDAANRITSPAPLFAILFSLLTYYAVRTDPFPRRWKVFVVAAVALMPVVALSREPFSTGAWAAYLVAILVEIVRVERSGRTVRREGASVLLSGLALLAAFSFLQVAVSFRLVPAFAGISAVYAVGVLASVVAMSLFLAGEFARTSRHLESRLVEVETLSRQVLEQERTAHAADLRARLVEAENARKGRELEAARNLQLSMLPTSLPDVAGLDIAVSMTTASEVGGDYYDFRAGTGGDLLIGVGDATGHGAAAGIMVTAVKALFTTLAAEHDLVPILTECDRVLRGMNVQPRHMCLELARVSREAVTVCSAAMPPVLVYRARTAAVEELGTGGLPLGGRLSPAYEERRLALGPGDTLLLASDGFAEALDAAGEPLGFDAAAALFRSACGRVAGAVVERLEAALAARRGGRDPSDDVTFVVVRITDSTGPDPR